MHPNDDQARAVAIVEQRIAELSEQLARAQRLVQEWTEANASLSRNAAAARAKNQGMGRGIMGSLLGSGYRSSMRRAATSSNAAIAKEVADKKAKIAEGKLQAQETVRRLKIQLADAKQELKQLTANSRSQTRTRSNTANSASASLDLLHKLKQAYEDGLLTEAEYEEKRKKLISEI
jgi:cell division septum initiation protein DivIVA